MRVVLDTNVFISGIFWSGKPYKILEAWKEGKIKLIVSLHTLSELLRVLDEEFNMSKKDVKGWERLILEKGIIVEPTLKVNVIEDKPDNMFLECALAGNAEYIVSGDSHLLALGEYKGIKIVRVKEMLGVLIQIEQRGNVQD